MSPPTPQPSPIEPDVPTFQQSSWGRFSSTSIPTFQESSMGRFSSTSVPTFQVIKGALFKRSPLLLFSSSYFAFELQGLSIQDFVSKSVSRWYWQILDNKDNEKTIRLDRQMGIRHHVQFCQISIMKIVEKPFPPKCVLLSSNQINLFVRFLLHHKAYL